jgi:ketosteroid isomerase-like protein
MELERVVEAGDRAAVAVRVRAEGVGSGVSIDQRFGHLLTFRDGRLLRFEWFLDLADAIRAVAT